MNTTKMISEIKSTCATLEAEKSTLIARVKELDDRITGYRMAIDALELTLQRKQTEPASACDVSPVADPVQEKSPEKYGANTNVTLNGKTQTIKQWAKDLNMTVGGIMYRLKKGWPVEDAIGCQKAPGVTVIPRKPYQKAARKVFKCDMFGNPIRQYTGIADAAKDLRMSETTVQKIIEHVSKSDQLKAHEYYLTYSK